MFVGRRAGLVTAVRSVLAAFLACLLPAGRAAAHEPEIDLRRSADPVLPHSLEEVVAAQGQARAVAEKHLALSLVDLSSPGRPRLAMLNGDTMLYAASLPKIAILLGAGRRSASAAKASLAS